MPFLESRGTSISHEADEALAQSIFESFYDDDAQHDRALEILKEGIEAAIAGDPRSWSVTLFERRVRLNIGPRFAMDVGRGGVTVRVASHDDVPQVSGFEYGKAPNAKDLPWVFVPADKLYRWREDVRPHFLASISNDRQQRAQYARSHCTGFVRFLEAEIGVDFDDSWQAEAAGNQTRYWAFQANPDAFDISENFRDEDVGRIRSWAVSAHRDAIKRADVVLLWSVAGTKGVARGFYAVAQVVGAVTEGGSDYASHSVPIVLVDVLEPPILEDELKTVSELAQLAVVGGSQGTNFSISPDEWNALSERFPRVERGLDGELPPAPTVLTVPKQKELRQLLSDFLGECDYRSHTAEARESREKGRENFEKVVSSRAEGQGGVDAVLHKLLPHVNSDYTREHDHWVSIAPAINKDIKTWFEGSKWVQPDEWEEVVEALLDFYKRAEAGELEAACEDFSRKGLKGFQAGILSPMLNALRPADYFIVNKKTIDTLAYLTGQSYSSQIEEYPELNETLHELSGRVEALLPDDAAVGDIDRRELLDVFSHWLVAVRRIESPGAKLRYYKVSPGAKAFLWEECRQGGFIAIGWDELGDLSGFSRADFEKRLDEMQQEHPTWTKNAMWQVWQVARLRQGDKVLANNGTREILGFGTVSGDYYYAEDAEDHRHRVPVEWFDTDVRHIEQGGWRRTVITLKEEDWQAFLDLPPEPVGPGPGPDPDPPIAPIDPPGPPSIARNEILFGPPGTGKTYITTRRAVELALAPEEELTQAEVRKMFREEKQNGRVEFVTFHQSYGYEEFVEGIRPQMDPDAETDLQFELQSGTFKAIALRAAAEGVSLEPTEPSFEMLWSQVLSDLRQAEEEGREPTPAPNDTEYLLIPTSSGNVRAHKVDRAPDGEPVVRDEFLQGLKKYNRALWRRRDDLGTELSDYTYSKVSNIVAEELGTGGGCHGNIQWMMHLKLLEASRESHKRDSETATADRLGTLMELLRQGRTHELNYDGTDQYVLVIDEINRGNISKILGELITLLEPSKRLTKPDELVLQLPYSKEPFGVPPNLHVIGTMNTADRSIALMDVALRRRFEFVEMMPDVNVVRDALAESVGANVHGGKAHFVNLVCALFDNINARIRFLYDDDHQLGHSFFMKASSYFDLREVLVSAVVPMLREYFYGSWERVCACLGCPYEDGRPARPTSGSSYTAAIVECTPVIERDLLGFDHIDYQDTSEYRVASFLAERDLDVGKLQTACLDALSGEFRDRVDQHHYYS